MSIQNARGGSISEFWTQLCLPKAVSVPPSVLHFRAFRGGRICWTFGSPRGTSCTLCYKQCRWQHLCLTFADTSHCKTLFSVVLKFPKVFWCVCLQLRFSVYLFLISAAGKVRTLGLPECQREGSTLFSLIPLWSLRCAWPVLMLLHQICPGNSVQLLV